MKQAFIGAVLSAAFAITSFVLPSVALAQCASCNGVGGSCIHGPLQGENYEDCDDNPDLGICVEIGKKECGVEPTLPEDYAVGSALAVFARIDVLEDGTRVFRSCKGDIVAFSYAGSREGEVRSSTDLIEI